MCPAGDLDRVEWAGALAGLPGLSLDRRNLSALD
jgi:hypothetical protein